LYLLVHINIYGKKPARLLIEVNGISYLLEIRNRPGKMYLSIGKPAA